jgi:hypothetical protein
MIKITLSDSEVAELDKLLKARKPDSEPTYLTQEEWEALKNKFDQLSQM